MLAEAVIVAALTLLHGEGVVNVPPVTVVQPGELPTLSEQVNYLRAFRLRTAGQLDPAIYVVRTSAMFQSAERGFAPDIVLVAATILHEMQHAVGDGSDERGALLTEMRFVRSYVKHNLVRLATAERRWLERQADELGYRASKVLTPQVAGLLVP
jgi:hypothetical protein